MYDANLDQIVAERTLPVNDRMKLHASVNSYNGGPLKINLWRSYVDGEGNTKRGKPGRLSPGEALWFTEVVQEWNEDVLGG